MALQPWGGGKREYWGRQSVYLAAAKALTVRRLHVKLLALVMATLSEEGVFWCANANYRMG
jgi:hypothetical protein